MIPTGKVISALAIELEKLPVEGPVLTALAIANCGVNFTVKMVPTGVFVAFTVTVTGFVVPAGKATSAEVSEPEGLKGDAIPPIVPIESVGRLSKDGLLEAFTGPGENDVEGTGLIEPNEGITNASMRIRPLVPLANPGPKPPNACITPELVTSPATSRMAPALPPPPSNPEFAVLPESPPFAEINPVIVILVEEAIKIAPPPPPPEVPARLENPRPPAPPEPPNKGMRFIKELGAPYLPP